MSGVVGLLLAAGAGRRMGQPKALVTDPDGTSWLRRTHEGLVGGGCADVLAVLGACAGQSAALAPGLAWTLCPTWAEGLGASLAHGLRALTERDADAALVQLVDLPDVGAPVVARLLGGSFDGETLRRASYRGRAGHPVLIGRAHWAPIADSVSGDRGAGAYLARHGASLVECGDLAEGHDVDAR